MQRRAAWLLLGVSCTLLLLLSWAQRGHQVKKEHSQPSKEVLEVPDPSGSALPTPKAQLSAICALPEFRRGASLNATVVVFAWRRLESLRRLMRSLEHAIMWDLAKDRILQEYVDSFKQRCDLLETAARAAAPRKRE